MPYVFNPQSGGQKIPKELYEAIQEWSLAFYAYSSESYKPCLLESGKWFGTLEQAIKPCEVYLENG